MTGLLLASLLCAAPASAAPLSVTSVPAPAPFQPGFKKVMVVMLENTDYKEALVQPFLAELAKRGALLTNYHAVAHPSQPNYVAIVAGDTLGCADDEQIDFSASTRHLGDLLEAKGKTWGVYAEGYPGKCSTKMHAGKYARKHQPFMSFKNVTKDPSRCANVKPAKALDADAKAGRLPDFSLYVPDLDDDGHDTGSPFASKWLAAAFGPRLDDPAFMKDLLVVVTFDEDGGTKDNRVYAALIGAGVKPGSKSAARYTHYSLLRTVEDAFALGTLGRNDATASRIEGIWRDQ